MNDPSSLVADLDVRRLAKWSDPGRTTDEPRWRELDFCHSFHKALGGRTTRELPQRTDPQDLASTGWGVISTRQDRMLVEHHLRPLLEFRRRQAGAFFKHLFYEPPESAETFLGKRHGAAPGTIRPRVVPYYLLLVGGPEKIPFDFQYQLSVGYAVGRIAFEDPDDLERYAKAVVAAEKQGAGAPRRAVVFSVKNGDPSTKSLARHLVQPLEERLPQIAPGWDVEVWRDEQARKDALGRLLGGDATPGLLLVSCHGRGFNPEDPLQLTDQGALICQEWQGKGSPSREQYFHADNVADDARLRGQVAFLFACYGAGTPVLDNFWHEEKQAEEEGVRWRSLARESFVAQLPQALLRQGALAVVGHVDQGWTVSFSWVLRGKLRPTVETLEDTLAELFAGQRLGHAMRPLHRRYKSLAADLARLLLRIRQGEEIPENKLRWLWTAHNDARNFIVLGDPAVYLLGRRSEPSKNAASASAGLPAQIVSPAAAEPVPRLALDELPDLLIRVREGTRDGRSILSYELTARESRLGPNPAEFGPIELRLDPRSFFKEHTRAIESLSFEDAATHQQAVQQLADKGVNLTRLLLPEDLQEHLWDLQKEVGSIQIQSDEGSIPWELLKLWGKNEGHWATGPFLGEAFDLTRWRPRLPQQLRLSLDRVAVVATGQADLPAAKAEADAIEAILGPERAVRLPSTYDAVMSHLASGDFDGWHFTGHGLDWTRDPDLWSIILSDGELRPESLAGEAANLGRRSPLVVLNACHTGKGALSLTQVGGWPARFLEAGAGAFVGASWAVGDAAARTFAEAFYQAFSEGVSIGQAARQARQATRELHPGDPSWLAYAVFAHPLACVKTQAEQPRPAIDSHSETLEEKRSSDNEEQRRSEPPLSTAWPRARGRMLLAFVLIAALAILGLFIHFYPTEGPTTQEDGMSAQGAGGEIGLYLVEERGDRPVDVQYEFHTGDWMRFILHPAADGWLYIYHEQPEGGDGIRRRWPVPGQPPQRLTRRRSIFFPTPPIALRFDSRTGLETFYFVICRQPEACASIDAEETHEKILQAWEVTTERGVVKDIPPWFEAPVSRHRFTTSGAAAVLSVQLNHEK